MTTSSLHAQNTASLDTLQATFLLLLPHIRLHGEAVFGSVKCPHQKEECLAEMIALCWLGVLRLHEQGKDVSNFARPLSTFAVRAIQLGRRLCGRVQSRDALSPRTRRQHPVRSLNAASRRSHDDFARSLPDSTRLPPDEQVAFHCDWSAFLVILSESDRSIVDDLARGEPVKTVADRYHLSLAAIAEKRRQLHEDWIQFCTDTRTPAEV